MKFIFNVVAVLCLLALAKVATQTIDEPAFVKTFSKLHKGPPEQIEHSSATVTTEWIKQKLDHFDKNDNKTFEMRYMVNKEHFVKGGPIFIYVAGEWAISKDGITSGLFVDLAKEHKAMLFYVEHRYYGESKPTSHITVGHLQYLHVKQALADLAHFITTKRENTPDLANSKVILSGCSYSATMVVWFEKLYPHLLAGGWASSAPVLAKVDFKEYHEVVGKALRELGSEKCYNRIKNGIAELESMFAGAKAAEARTKLQLCANFNHSNHLDIASLFSSIANTFGSIVQYQLEGDIPQTCDFIMGFKDDLAAITGFWLSSFDNSTNCIDATYKESVEYYLDPTNDGALPWFYQTCNEFGWYQSSASDKQPFGSEFPASMYTSMCHDIYGSQYTSSHIHQLVDETNDDFGGKEPNVKNVYMTQGGLDPWSKMGLDAAEGATVIPHASHCSDLTSISVNDSSETRASKTHLGELVREWLD